MTCISVSRAGGLAVSHGVGECGVGERSTAAAPGSFGSFFTDRGNSAFALTGLCNLSSFIVFAFFAGAVAGLIGCERSLGGARLDESGISVCTIPLA
jgi:hypothetical protein